MRILLLTATVLLSCNSKNAGQSKSASEKSKNIYGGCTTEGEQFEAKVEGASCCEGLKQVQSFESLAPDGQCIYGLPSLLTCTKCGDGICGSKEHFCNCPEDCKREEP